MALRADWLDALVLKAAEAAVIVIDRERIVRYANTGAVRLAQRQSPEDLLGAPYLSILAESRVFDEDGNTIPPEKYPSAVAFETGRGVYEKVIGRVDRDGNHSWLEISSTPILDEAGTIAYVAISYRDISRRKLREDRLKFLVASQKIFLHTDDLESRLSEKVALLVPSLADWSTVHRKNEDGSLSCIAVAHRDGEKISLLRDLCERMKTPGETGVLYRAIQDGKGKLYSGADFKKLASGPETGTTESLLEALQPTSILVVPIIAQSGVAGVLSLAYSDTLRNYTEDDLEFMLEFGYHLGLITENARLYSEVQKREKMKDRFLAMLSHELRNPLAPIKNSLETLRLTINQPGAETEVSMIEHQFDHLAKILRDLLDVTRFTQAKVHLDRRPIDLGALVEKAIKTQQPFIRKKGIDLTMTVSGGPFTVSADPLRIEQTLINLLHNAEKYTPSGGRISVTLGVEENKAKITVSDTGIGIKKEDIGNVFELYYQSEQGGTSEVGLGIGLQLAKEVIDRHDGTITVSSAGPGTGATFTITLPLLPAHVRPETLDTHPPLLLTQKRKRILVVDDNRQAADSLAKLLSIAGHTVHPTYSGAEALDVFAKVRPDVAILDIGMPDVNGYLLIASLRNIAGRDFTAIALSGYGQPEDKKRSLSLGFDHHLTKPVGLADLAAVL